LLQLVLHFNSHATGTRIFTRGADHSTLQVAGLKLLRLSVCCLCERDSAPSAVEGAQTAEAVVASVVNLVRECLNTMMSPSPEPVMLAAVELLAALSELLPPLRLHAVPEMGALRESTQAVCQALPEVVQARLYVLLAHSLLPPGQAMGAADSQLEERGSALIALIAPLAQCVEEAATAAAVVQPPPAPGARRGPAAPLGIPPGTLRRTHSSLHALASCCSSYRTSHATMKRGILSGVAPALNAALALVPPCLASLPQAQSAASASAGVALARALLSFLHAALSALRKEVRAERQSQF
jgi:hypothetical protein